MHGGPTVRGRGRLRKQPPQARGEPVVRPCPHAAERGRGPAGSGRAWFGPALDLGARGWGRGDQLDGHGTIRYPWRRARASIHARADERARERARVRARGRSGPMARRQPLALSRFGEPGRGQGSAHATRPGDFVRAVKCRRGLALAGWLQHMRARALCMVRGLPPSVLSTPWNNVGTCARAPVRVAPTDSTPSRPAPALLACFSATDRSWRNNARRGMERAASECHLARSRCAAGARARTGRPRRPRSLSLARRYVLRVGRHRADD